MVQRLETLTSFSFLNTFNCMNKINFMCYVHLSFFLRNILLWFSSHYICTHMEISGRCNLLYSFTHSIIYSFILYHAAPPSAPQGLRVKAYSWDSIELAWDEPLGNTKEITAYAVEMRFSDQPTFRLSGKVDAFAKRVYQAYGLIEGEEYYFRVRPCTREGRCDEFAEIGPLAPRPPFGNF